MRLDDCTGGCFSDDMGCEDFVQTYDLFQPEVSCEPRIFQLHINFSHHYSFQILRNFNTNIDYKCPLGQNFSVGSEIRGIQVINILSWKRVFLKPSLHFLDNGMFLEWCMGTDQ